MCGPRLYFLNLVTKNGDGSESKVPVGSETDHNFIDFKKRLLGKNEIIIEYEST